MPPLEGVAGKAEGLTADPGCPGQRFVGAFPFLFSALMNGKIRLGISSCLLGNNVRYDGGHKHDRYITDTLGQWFDFLPVCPEVESGLPVPREAMRLVGDPAAPRLMTIKSRIDHTGRMVSWAKRKLQELEREDLCGFIFKSRSPSSGIGGVKVYTEVGMPARRGAGVFGGMFVQHFPLIPAEDDGRLVNPVLRENFIERVFVYKRWRELAGEKPSVGRLVSFHSDHKLLVMAHSPKHYTALGKLVAGAKNGPLRETFDAYIALLMDGLRLIATSRKNANVLQHIMGYFKKALSPQEKQELLEVIDEYRRERVPLVVPLVLIKHYLGKYPDPYLLRQVYLNPHPRELMLRNHV
jgi:uncharacterized protein YbgA (DUF1722 family)/uncharacterized protein YbbK (DUF523 family)